MGPEPATSKSRGSRYRSNEAQPNNHRGGDSMERGSQRSESGKGKSEKDGGESGRGVKRRSHGGGGGDGGGQGGKTSGVLSSSTHRSSKRWRGDALETLDIPIPTTDRWDGGGTSDTPKENAFSSSGKSNKHESSEGRNGEGISAKGSCAQLFKEGGDRDSEKVSRKQKVSKSSLVLSESRAITVMDLQETDGSIIDSNIRIKNKVSYRRETTLELGEPEQSVDENAKNAVEASRSRRRWDRDGHRGGAEDLDEAHARVNVGREGSQDRDRKKERSIGRDRERDREGEWDRERERDRDRDRDPEARIQNGRRSAERSRDFAGELDGRLEMSDDLDASNDFKIQEELRNIELEKELENRIRRRREESGDRDRWRDDDRERDVKRRSNSRERDERAREERHRSRRERERHSDRYESRQHREGSKVSEGRQREERYYESDREYRSHREERYHGTRSKDVEDQGRSERNRDQEHRDRKGQERSATTGYEAERRVRGKGPKEEHSDRERSHPITAYVESSDGARSEHRHKRVRESDGEGYGTERDHSRQRSRPGESDSMTGNEVVHDDRPTRNREDRDTEGRLEGSRGSPRDSDERRGKGYKTYRNDVPAPAEMGGEGISPRHEVRSPSSHRVDYMSSPHLDDQRSPRYRSQRSPSHMDRSSGASRGKTGHGEWFESSTSASSCPQKRSQGPGLLLTDRRDRAKWNSEEEVKGGMFRVNRGADEGREGSLSPHRFNDQYLPATQSKPPLHGQDGFPRVMGGRGMMEARSDRGGWRGPGAFDGGALEHHGPDDLSPRDRNDRMRRMPMNRPPGSPMVRSQGPQMSPAPPLAPLPPPPPFRPGIDNPAVLGPGGPGGGFDDAGGSRDQGRGERKGGPHRRGDPGGIGPGEGWRGVNMGNWNSRNQGPLPGNGFQPFPPQFGHPPGGGGGFPGMGQQFPGPPIFPGGGGRPPMDIGFGGGRFLGPGGHMGEGGDGYLGPGRGAGWHGPGEVDDGRGPPMLGPGDGWEGPGPHGDDRLRHGLMEWERGGPMGVRGWERDREREIWEARRDGAPEFMPHRPQMDAAPQNQAFPSAGSGWIIPRDSTQMPNDLKPRQDRQPFDVQEMKRKPDGGPPKPKVSKSSGRAVSTSEGKLAKYATATMQSVLSQLDISPELAGPELYAQYLALLPASADAKQSIPEEQENVISEPKDEDLNLEADPEAEALIAGPNFLAKLLPPLPDGVFQEALRLYRKPEIENRLQKSSRGCFVLPFDPATIKVPSISMRLNGHSAGKANDGDHDAVGRLLDDLDINVLSTEFAEEFIKPSDELVNAVEPGQEGVGLEGAEVEDREGEAMPDEFISSNVEVAEYSDREFDAEMEDTLEYDSLKEIPVDGNLSEPVDTVDDEKDSVDLMTVYKESIDPVDTLVHSTEFLTEVDSNWQVVDGSKSESVVAEMGNREDNIVVEADPVDNSVIEADRVDKNVVEADQVDNTVVEVDIVNSVVVKADQMDTIVIEANQADNVVNEAAQLDNVVVGADQVDNVVVEAARVDIVVVEADRFDIVVVGADRVDNVVVETERVDNLVLEAYQVDNVFDEVDPVDGLVDEAQRVDNPVDEADVGENVNSFVVSKGAVNYDNSDQHEKNDVVEEEVMMLEEETVYLEGRESSEALTGEFVKPPNVQFPAEIFEGSPLDIPVPKEVIEAAEDFHEEILETKQATGVENEIQEALASVENKVDFKDVEAVRVPELMNGEGNGLDVKQDPSESRAVESIENHLPEVLTTVIEDDVRMETNGKLKEILENSPAADQPVIEVPQPESLTRPVRQRRASTRLLAQQAVEAQVLTQQADDLMGQGSKKSGRRGSTRSTQRRSKRRGSTH